nr:tail tubular protein A [uncultured Mediterranean phage uvMED]
MATLQPTTKLEAVNVMLTSIGEAPVNSLISGLEDAELAETILESVNKETQSKGWIFNTDLKLSLSPNTDNQIVLPDNYLRVDTRGTLRSSSKDIVERGRKLYDRIGNSFTFTDPVTVDVVILLDFTDIPEVARRYITIRSARIFQDRVLSSTNIHGFQLQDEQQAYIELQDYHAETADFNIFDNYDTFAPLDRNIYGEHYITNTLTETSS